MEFDLSESKYRTKFLDFSTAITGFTQFELRGTGQVDLYFETIQNIIGSELFRELLDVFYNDGYNLDCQKSKLDVIFLSGKLGPIARSILKLWYSATWEQLPSEWHEKFGLKANDNTFVVSPYAYSEGLVWRSIGVNPPAAKAPGYGTWSEEPKFAKEYLEKCEAG